MIERNLDGSYTVTAEDDPKRVLEIPAKTGDADIKAQIDAFLGPPTPEPPTLEEIVADLQKRVAVLEGGNA